MMALFFLTAAASLTESYRAQQAESRKFQVMSYPCFKSKLLKTHITTSAAPYILNKTCQDSPKGETEEGQGSYPIELLLGPGRLCQS